MKTVLTVLFILLVCGPAAAQDLPPDILADQYLLEATKALENGDPQGALRAFGKIEALDTEPPVEFLFFYGKLLVENSTALDDLLKGQSLLKQFVLNVEKDSEHYTPTLELLSVVGTKLEKAEAERQAEERRCAEEARRQAEAEHRAKAERQRQAKLREQLPQLLAILDKQMVHIQGGSFTMGCRPSFWDDYCDIYRGLDGDGKPVPQIIEVGDFYISKYEVTQEIWKAVMGWNPGELDSCPRCPAHGVSFDTVQEFLKKLNLTGAEYRLPTDTEWEYAARGGQRSREYKYAGSDNPDMVAWHGDNSDGKIHPVGQKQPNELGLYDMSGNVSEWARDCYNRKHGIGPCGPDSHGYHRGYVLRGSSAEYTAERISHRDFTYYPSVSLVGFRVARSLP